MKGMISAILALCLLLPAAAALPSAAESAGSGSSSPVIWRHPGRASARNLFYGPGSRALAPAPPFRFIEEDKGGSTPKFDVRDRRGVKWAVKLGPEAQAETASTRLVWAAGYFVEEVYYFPRVQIAGLGRLSRGAEYVEGRGVVRGARFEARRPEVERGDNWSWSDNPFVNTRELNGLKVLMIMLNNWDVKPTNNNIFIVRNRRSGRREARYLVSDLGATLGRAEGYGGPRSKNDVRDFITSRFIEEIDDGEVKFDYDVKPTRFGWVTILCPPCFMKHVKKDKDMSGIPVGHARWLGSLLAGLTQAQLEDAFRAAGYDRATRQAYAVALRQRINQLASLPSFPGSLAYEGGARIERR